MLDPNFVEKATGGHIRPEKKLGQFYQDVHQATGITPALMMSSARQRHVVKARWLAWYLAHESGCSYRQIANATGRDRSGVMYGIKKIRNNVDKPNDNS